MTKLGNLVVGRKNQTTIMGILNTSPESFYKNSIKSTKSQISKHVSEMEENGAEIIDVGGMSTAPYLRTIVSEKVESERVTKAIKIIQNSSNIPISVDTCRATVANTAVGLNRLIKRPTMIADMAISRIIRTISRLNKMIYFFGKEST